MINFSNTIFLNTTNFALFYPSVFFISLIGVYLFRGTAIKYNIIANPNFRTSHEVPLPKGGGIVFSVVFVFGVFSLYWKAYLTLNLLLILGIGPLAALLFGFIDDLIHITAKKKIVFQLFLSFWALFWLNGGPLFSYNLFPYWLSFSLASLILVCAINAFNFMDGIDGMASSGSFMSALILSITLLFTNGSSELLILFMLLSSSLLAFIIFNWPPASIFMGDTGSVFLGYLFGVLMLISVMRGEISLWTWIVVFGYFISDTTFTFLARLMIVKKWYGAHRSHAYQNLARITNSHLKVTLGVLIFHLLWLLPLAFLTIFKSDIAFLWAILAILPGFIVAYKYGPLLSSS